MGMELYNEYADFLEDSYVGKAQRATFTFSLGPEQCDFINSFFANRYISDCKSALMNESPGDNILHLQVYRDTAPTWTTAYQLVITATDRRASPLPWLAIIGLALVAIAIVYFVVRPLLKSVQDLIYGPSGGGGGGGVGGSSLLSMIPWIVGGVVGVLLLTRGSKQGVSARADDLTAGDIASGGVYHLIRD